MPQRPWPPESFVGGALCLDFANTLSGRDGPAPRERLHGAGDLFAWAAAAGAVDPGTAAALAGAAADDPAAAAALMDEARALREAIYAVFAAVAAGSEPPGPAFERLDRAVADALGRLALTPSGDGRRCCAWSWRDPNGALRRPLWAVARSAGELLTGADRDRLRECRGRDCAWLFLDTSKNAQRRWCDMRACGNRAKAQRHYRRARGGAKPAPAGPAARPSAGSR